MINDDDTTIEDGILRVRGQVYLARHWEDNLPPRRDTAYIACWEPCHDPVPYELLTFMRIESGEWRPAVSKSGSPGMYKGLYRTAAVIVDDEFNGNDVRRAAIVEQDHRLRYNFKCDCGLAVPARAEKLYPILNRMSETRYDVITLRGLAAML